MVKVTVLQSVVHGRHNLDEGATVSIGKAEADELKKLGFVEEYKGGDATLDEPSEEDLLGVKMDEPVENKMAEPVSNKTTKTNKAK